MSRARQASGEPNRNFTGAPQCFQRLGSRLIDSPYALRPRTVGAAIFESVLSDSNGLRYHFRVASSEAPAVYGTPQRPACRCFLKNNTLRLSIWQEIVGFFERPTPPASCGNVCVSKTPTHYGITATYGRWPVARVDHRTLAP
jgi:hypothetical protein